MDRQDFLQVGWISSPSTSIGLVLLGFILTVVLACAPAATPSPTATAKPTATPTPTTVATPSPTPTSGSQAAKPSGVLKSAISDIGVTSMHPKDCPACWFLGQASVWEPLLQQDRGPDGNLFLEPWLASSWKIAEDGLSVELTLRNGVQFHKGWGELTAQDVAFSFDQANHNINPDSIHGIGTEFVNFISKPIEVVDEHTFRITWDSHIFNTEMKLLTSFFKTMGFLSKKVYDEKGAEWMRNNMVSTGPFVLDEWTEHNRMVLSAFDQHWQKVPYVEQVIHLEVKEGATRRAMLESGQVHVAEISVKEWPQLLAKSQFKKAPEGTLINYGFVAGGNYWEKTHPISGVPLQRELRADLPWVGDPDNPQGFERARKVRQALTLAIDREGINQAVFGGLASIAWQGGIDNYHPVFRDEWKVSFDPDKARQLLKEAGYPDGFTLRFFCSAGSTECDIAKAMAEVWRAELNVNTDLLIQPYGTYRPNYINRTSFEYSFRAGGGFAPPSWPEEWLISAVVAARDGTPGGGFNSGIEIPAASVSIKKKESARTEQEALQATVELYNYISHQAVWPSTVQIVQTWIYNAEVITDWRMRPTGSLGIPRNLEWARLRSN